MATIRAYTTIEQSRKLAEILPLESADMKWSIPADNEGEFIEEVSLIKYKSEYALFDKITDWNDTPYLPCWSLAKLLDILPKIYGAKPILDLEENSIQYTGIDLYVVADNPVDACVAMIELLHELKML
jgi:hypothetical protein